MAVSIRLTTPAPARLITVGEPPPAGVSFGSTSPMAAPTATTNSAVIACTVTDAAVTVGAASQAEVIRRLPTVDESPNFCPLISFQTNDPARVNSVFAGSRVGSSAAATVIALVVVVAVIDSAPVTFTAPGTST